MLSVPQNLENLSLSLSEVLSDIGVNDVMVSKRRYCALFRESVRNICSIMYKTNDKTYLFGSQSDGLSTSALNSVEYWLISSNKHHVIHNLADWKPGVKNLLMVQDETTAPGYCLLQCLRNDAPHAANCCPNNNYYMDAKRRVILKNTLYHYVDAETCIGRNGPAVMPPLSVQAQGGYNLCFAYRCERWPVEARGWLNRRNVGGWPSAQLKSESANSGCFLVPVGSKLGGINQLEWRISTSLAERYLMFSLNTAHLKCYLLMKMLLKLHRVFHGVISSYMCKTALFHCIEITSSEFWQDHNLLLCLNEISRVLYNCIYFKNCPHFIMPENNLMADRISDEQQHNLLEVIQHIISSNGRQLFEIRTHYVGTRLHMKLNRIPVYPRYILTPVEVQKVVSVIICYDAAVAVINERKTQLIDDNNIYDDTLRKLLSYYIRGYQNYPYYSDLEQKAHSCVVPLLCSTIGSLLASYNATLNRPLSDNALSWLKLGLGSDVSSGLLKLATVYYSVGDIDLAEARLRQVDQQYDKKIVMPVCGCGNRILRNEGFNIEADQRQVTDFRHIVSYCVVFMLREINIVPTELVQEYFRSTSEEYQVRNTMTDEWMDNVVVDSLPYLYFLQYKTYGRLGNHGEQQRALHKLHKVAIFDKPNLKHKETALNLLGQCMEQENLPIEALYCYKKSLEVRSWNNAAQFYKCRMLKK